MNKDDVIDYISITGRTPENKLERMLFDSVYEETLKNAPYVIENSLINLNDKGELNFVLKKQHLYDYSDKDFNSDAPDNNKEGLGLNKWFQNYKKEAAVSTAGIRGQQNILFPWDTRYPINLIGVALATVGKALAAKHIYGEDTELHKIAATEVRYNSDKYLDLIARIQAAFGIITHLPVNRQTIPIWLASFLAFKLDLLGGEYVTSSHGQSVKTATKDINDQGSQYLPEESMLFVDQIENIIEHVEVNGSYTINISPSDHSNIKENIDGVDLYVDYLMHGVASDTNINLIKGANNPVIIENIGGSSYKTLSRVLYKLGIDKSFEWFNTEEDPFFHNAGKTVKNGKFYDYSADASLLIKNNDGTTTFPVLETLGYKELLKDKKAGTCILITDPDHDRLSITQIENSDRISRLNELGIDYMDLENGNVLAIYTPNQGFLMLMDFYAQQLKDQGKWDDYDRFIIKTTASAMSWDQWAAKNGIKVVNVPVGFKEIASIMKKVEKQIKVNESYTLLNEILVKDVFGNEINLGKNPRLVFAGEESGGMIMGPEKLIESNSGRKAIAMREKSATEAIIIASALVSKLENTPLSERLSEVFEKNGIIGRYDVREDIVYYNESLPIQELTIAKQDGEKKRTKNDVFYLSIALAKQSDKINIEQTKNILNETFPELTFDNLKDVKFVGDGTYLEFSDKYIEVRPSGTDAKTKAYGAGIDKAECLKYAQMLGNYSGNRTSFHQKLIPDSYFEEINETPRVKEIALTKYENWSKEGAPTDKVVIPDYKNTLNNVI